MAWYTLPPGEPRRNRSRLGATFTRTCNGFIIRHRVAPIQRRTIIQKRNRALFLAAVTLWRSLDSTQRQSFIDAAPTYTRTNSLGNAYVLSGSQVQSSNNQNRFLEGLTPITTGSNYAAPDAFTISGGAANISPVVLEITIDPVTVPADHILLVSVTPVGAYTFPDYPPNSFRNIVALDPGVYGTIDLLPWYQAIFGELNPEPGQNIIIGLQSMSLNPAIKSDFYFVVLNFI